MENKRIIDTGYSLIAFFFPYIAYISNSSSSLGFADAAEFALVSHLNSIAHPPGFPSYVILSHFWSDLITGITGDHIKSLVWFSSLCAALATFFLYRSICMLFDANGSFLNIRSAALTGTLAVAFGVTYWHWAHSVEVYALHSLGFSMLIYGMAGSHKTGNTAYALIAGTGIGIGLANHHLTMVLFLPLVVLWLMHTNDSSRNERRIQLSQIFKKNSIILILTSLFFTVMYYTFMYVRAGNDIVYKFGNPDNFSRLWYHLSGGAWIKNTTASVSGLIELRFPYFMQLTFEQLFIFLPFFFFGIQWLWKSGMRGVLLGVLAYYLVVLIYQLRIDQTSDTDAYMILPFILLSIPVSAGLISILKWRPKLIFILPVLTLLQFFVNFHKTDARDFDVSESLMEMLDDSAPEGAVILISDWTLVSQYHYYRITKGFRPDLTVLNYDLKFTNYKIVPELYPAFYDSIKVEYNTFISKLGSSHPQEIYNTGCTLDTPELMNAYVTTVNRIKEYCRMNKLAFMADPKAFVFMIQNSLMTGASHVSGCLVSDIPTGKGSSFTMLPFQWLQSDLVLRQPACTDKIVDFEAMLDFHRNYHASTGNTKLQQQADDSFMKIKTLQRKIKRKMPFVYRDPRK
jgi:hypothetical protein